MAKENQPGATPENPTGAEDRVLKSGMVKVRAGNQAVNVDGIHIAAKAEGEVPAKRLASLGSLVTKVGCLLLGLVLLAGSVQAQQYSTPALASGGTNNVAAASTNIYGSITLTKNDEFGLFLSSVAISASTSNTVWYVDASLDNTNWTTINAITKTQTGTTAATVGTNIYVGAAGYARVRCAIPDNLVALTNITVRYSLKPTRHGG
ncbi:MAG: hypothetical protein NTZ16_12665 [Verrucomicrobia bacterium]|nr:hypothetical protein [Verrucomicrobiota bacterium]